MEIQDELVGLIILFVGLLLFGLGALLNTAILCTRGAC